MENEKKKRIKVICPNCGYEMPITYGPESECVGVFVSCKGRNCKNVFEVKIKDGQQYR